MMSSDDANRGKKESALYRLMLNLTCESLYRKILLWTTYAFMDVRYDMQNTQYQSVFCNLLQRLLISPFSWENREVRSVFSSK